MLVRAARRLAIATVFSTALVAGILPIRAETIYDACPNQHLCGATTCEANYTCCPLGYPLLNTNDCRCYPDDTDTSSGDFVACSAENY